MIPKYTQRASVPSSTGMQPVSLSLATSPLSGVGEAIAKVSAPLEAAAGRIQAREDIISSAVSNDEFEQQTQRDYNATIEAGNVLDPKLNTIGNFNAGVEQRILQTVNNFEGSANARAQLEANLRGRAGQYANQMIKYQNTEQRKYITDIAQNEMAPIISAITKDPSLLRGSVEQIEAIVSKYAPALDPDSQRSLRDAALSGAMEQSVAGMLNRGDYKGANSMLLDNPILMRYLDPSKKDQFNKQIADSVRVENKSRAEMAGRIATFDMLKSAGYPVDLRKASDFILGAQISPDATLGEKIALNAKGLDLTENDLNGMDYIQLAELGGLKIQRPDKTDLSQEYTKAGVLTPKGATKQVEPFLKDVVLINKNITGIRSAYESWKGGNKTSGLMVLVQFLKLADGGTAVRGEDITMANTTLSAYERFEKVIAETTKGQAVSDALVIEAAAAAEAFVENASVVSKRFIDDVMKVNNFSYAQVGVYENTYNNLFGKVRTVPKRTAAGAPDAAAQPAAAAVPAGAPEYGTDPITGKVVRKK